MLIVHFYSSLLNGLIFSTMLPTISVFSSKYFLNLIVKLLVFLFSSTHLTNRYIYQRCFPLYFPIPYPSLEHNFFPATPVVRWVWFGSRYDHSGFEVYVVILLTRILHTGYRGMPARTVPLGSTNTDAV